MKEVREAKNIKAVYDTVGVTSLVSHIQIRSYTKKILSTI
jgi:hypothetical protein